MIPLLPSDETLRRWSPMLDLSYESPEVTLFGSMHPRSIQLSHKNHYEWRHHGVCSVEWKIDILLSCVQSFGFSLGTGMVCTLLYPVHDGLMGWSSCITINCSICNVFHTRQKKKIEDGVLVLGWNECLMNPQSIHNMCHRDEKCQ